MNPLGHLAGSVKTRAGEPVPGQVVEIWIHQNPWLEASPVAFREGPIRTKADGKFQTPDNLMSGTAYRAVVRAPGMEPAFSDWITIGAAPQTLPPIELRPLRSLRGRVVDRKGMPIVGIVVFQSGDGPEATRALTDSAGRFTLGGYCPGPVFVFARGEGFRFTGRLVKPAEADSDITLEVTRVTERPAREMRMLPDPIPFEESRALARRLLEPYWKGFDSRSNDDKVSALRSFARVDPIGVLGKLDAVKYPFPTVKGIIHNQLMRILVQIDPAEAETVAESVDVPFARARALLLVVDALPDKAREHKLVLVERALLQAKNVAVPGQRVGISGVVASRLYDLGRRKDAEDLFAEALRLSDQININKVLFRSRIAGRLACVNLPAALKIVEEVRASEPELVNEVLHEIALRLAAANPAEAERVLLRIPAEAIGNRFNPDVIWKMASVDPAAPGG